MGTMVIHKEGQFPEKVKLPDRNKWGVIKTHYPFKEMEVGDSIYVTGIDRRKTVGRAATVWGKRHNAKFKRKTDAHGVLVTRIA